MGNLADIFQARGQLNESIQLREEKQIPVLRGLGDRREFLLAQTNLAVALRMRGHDEDLPRAHRLLEEALKIAESMKLPEAERIRGTLRDFGWWSPES